MSKIADDERAALGCLETLIRECERANRELATALEQVLEADDARPADVAGLEGRAAGLIVEAQRLRDGLMAEAARQGRTARDLDEIANRCLASKPPLGFKLSRDSEPADRTRWHIASDAGRADAQFVLGASLLAGLGNQSDPKEAARHLKRAADQGHLHAMFDLAGLMHEGRGLVRDERGGVAMLRKAADAGCADACYALAMVEFAGADGKPDTSAGMQLLTRAAKAGLVEAQLELGRLCATGQLGEIDHAAAVKWLTAAKTQHRWAAIDWLRHYEAMSPNEYRNAAWLEAFNPQSQPAPQPTGLLGKLISFGFLGLLIMASVKGNSLGLFLLFLFVAVMAHEAGHYFVGRLVGIPTRVFCAGIGPLLCSFGSAKRRLPTRFDVRLLPLLGYVEAYLVPRGVWNYWQQCWKAEDAGQPKPPLPDFDIQEPPNSVVRYFSRPRRLAYYLGGVAVNFLLAVSLFWVYENYTQSGREMASPIAGRVPAGSLAAGAGLREGDRFVSIDGAPVTRGFFEVLDKLARSKTPTSVVVHRGNMDVTLTWPPSSESGEKDAAERRGLFMPKSWRIEDVDKSEGEHLQPGDEIRSFSVGDVSTTRDEPTAHETLHRAFAEYEGKPVTLTISRSEEASPRLVAVLPRKPAQSNLGEGKYKAPFKLESLREVGPPTSFGQVLWNVGTFGARMIVDLPSEVGGAVTRSPSEEEKSQLMKSVKRDPSRVLMIFASINMFLLFFNLLPVPPLDGFHVACNVIEATIRRDLPARAMSILTVIGWVILAAWLLLNVLLMLRDLAGSVI